MFYDLKDKKPKNSGENWVAPNATIIGDVTLEKNTSIWFNAEVYPQTRPIHDFRSQAILVQAASNGTTSSRAITTLIRTSPGM